MPKAKSTIRRRIQFFTTHVLEVNGGAATVASDPGVFLKKLKMLPYEDTPSAKGRSRQITEDVFEAVDVEAKGAEFRGRLYRTKYSDFPLVGKGEKDAPLTLDSDSGLRHPTHFVWWNISKLKEVNGVPAPHVGLLGAEFNLSGPRARALEQYVHDRFDGRYALTVLPLMDPEVWEHLMAERYVRRVSARVLEPRGLGAAKGNFAGLDVPDELDHVREFSWMVKPKRGHSFDLKKIASRLLAMLKKSEQEVRIAVETMDGQLIDVTESRITGTDYVKKTEDGSKSVSPAHMYEAIRNAYDKLGGRIARGLGRVAEEPVGAGDEPLDG